MKSVRLESADKAAVVVAVLNTSLFYWWFVVLSDCRHLNLREISGFPLNLGPMMDQHGVKLGSKVVELMDDYQKHAERKNAYYSTTGQVSYDEFFPRYSKSIIDSIDMIIAHHYGFTDEELDFIINYDIKYRMGKGADDGAAGDDEE